jgi:hypothetical protein
MKSQKLGTITSGTEVVNISAHGVWLYVNSREFFLPHAEYPWFRNATLGAVLNVQLLHETHLRWPDLDVDLELDSIENPEEYPLTYT